MKSGRVSRRVRQWSNFCFLSLLLCCVGWFAWQTLHEQMVEVPQGHLLVSKKSSFAFWRKPEFVIRGEGKYRASKREVEAIETGKMFCIAANIKVDFSAKLETTSLSEALKSKLGMGQRSFASVSGSFDAEFNRSLLSDATSEDVRESIIEKVRESIKDTLAIDKRALRIEARETIAGDISKALQDKLGCSEVRLDLGTIEYPQEVIEEGVTVLLRDGDFVAPKLLSEVSTEGYFAVGAILVMTLLGYGFVRLFFGEVIGLFVALIASAFGYNVAHEAGYYNSRRPSRRSSGVPDIGPILDGPISAAADAVQAGAHAMDGADIGDAISGAADIADGVGTIFDVLGGLSDIF